MLGSKIKSLRMKRCLTQEQLAKELCVSRQAVAKWETAGGMLDIENIKNLARFFNQSLDEFINETDETKMIRKLTNSILIFFTGIGVATIFLIDELVFEQIFIWGLFTSFMIYLGCAVKIIVTRYYFYQVKRRRINQDELGQLLIEGAGNMYLDPNYNLKAFFHELKNIWKTPFFLAVYKGW